MSFFRVDLKKIIDDSYDIEIGYELSEKLIEDIKNGLVENISKFVIVTDSNVKNLYAEKICTLL
jgi:3-dehydroquinate synthase